MKPSRDGISYLKDELDGPWWKALERPIQQRLARSVLSKKSSGGHELATLLEELAGPTVLSAVAIGDSLLIEVAGSPNTVGLRQRGGGH